MKPLILLTNDDGVASPGLIALADAMASLGELVIVAPARQQTGRSRSLRSDRPTGVIQYIELGATGAWNAFSVQAPPALTVVHGILECAPRKPDLVISGINYGENIGRTISASGTVGAALEAAAFGIPAIAVSQEAPSRLHASADFAPLSWSTSSTAARRISAHVLSRGLPGGVEALNINVPSDATSTTPLRATVQSRQAHVYFVSPPRREWLRPVSLPLAPRVEEEALEQDSDIRCLLYERAISVSPLTGMLAAPVELKEVAQYLD